MAMTPACRAVPHWARGLFCWFHKPLAHKARTFQAFNRGRKRFERQPPPLSTSTATKTDIYLLNVTNGPPSDLGTILGSIIGQEARSQVRTNRTGIAAMAVDGGKD